MYTHKATPIIWKIIAHGNYNVKLKSQWHIETVIIYNQNIPHFSFYY